MKEQVERLICVIEEVANGNHSDDIMEFTKPGYADYIQRTAEAVGMMMVKVEAREHRLEQLIDELRELNEKLKRNILKTVATIANALGARDNYTEGHAVRVASYAVRLAGRLGLPESQIEPIAIGAVLHDIGKIGFSDRLFSGQDVGFTADMREEIHRHPEIGANILHDLDFLGTATDYVQYHHERLDGSGYPYGLKGEEIPLGARIVAIADCFDAITSERCYQKGRNCEQAFGILREMSGTHLEPQLVEIFIQEIEENGLANGRDGCLETKYELHHVLTLDKPK